MEPFRQCITKDDTAFIVLIELADQCNEFIWDPICTKYLPKAFSVYTVERLLKIDEVHVQGVVPLQTLLNDVPECKDLVNTSSSLSEASLLRAELFVDGIL